MRADPLGAREFDPTPRCSQVRGSLPGGAPRRRFVHPARRGDGVGPTRFEPRRHRSNVRRRYRRRHQWERDFVSVRRDHELALRLRGRLPAGASILYLRSWTSYGRRWLRTELTVVVAPLYFAGGLREDRNSSLDQPGQRHHELSVLLRRALSDEDSGSRGRSRVLGWGGTGSGVFEEPPSIRRVPTRPSRSVRR
jgi:hypothetical protein